jgi:hypothetical protein
MSETFNIYLSNGTESRPSGFGEIGEAGKIVSVCGWNRRTTWSFWRIARNTFCCGRPTWLNSHTVSGNCRGNLRITGERERLKKAEAAPRDGFVTLSTHGR